MKKLTLNKEVIANLNGISMISINGGATITPPPRTQSCLPTVCDYSCPTHCQIYTCPTSENCVDTIAPNCGG